MEYLKWRTHKQTKQPSHYCMDQSNPELLVPSLNLNQTLSTNQTTLTDRYFSKTSKFIPMRTQRSCLNKSHQLKSANSLNHNQTSAQNQELNMLEIADISVKRFTRKADFPLTSDRFRLRSEIKAEEEGYDLVKH